MAVKSAVIAITLLSALYFDLRYHKIKNFITVPAALSGFVLNTVERGSWGFLFSLKGWITPVALLIILYSINVMGAGDIKLLAAVGSIMGASSALNCIIFSIYFGAVIALFILIKNRSFKVKISRLLNYLYFCFTVKKLVPYSHERDYDSKFPFSLAIVPAVAVELYTTGMNL